MAKSINNVMLMGRLTRDAELKTTNNGKSVTEFSLAVDKGNDGASFFDVVAWEKTAEIINQYTNKGSRVLVQGRLDQQTWEKDGQKRSKVVVIAFDVTLLDSKTGSQPDSAPSNQESDQPIDLSQIPF